MQYNPSHGKIRNDPFWTRDSSILLGIFVTIFLILYIWWPLAEEVSIVCGLERRLVAYMDWLLFGIFGFMSITIIARANLKTDCSSSSSASAADWQLSYGAHKQTSGIITPQNVRPCGSSPPGRLRILSIDRITRFLNWIDQKVTRESEGNSSFLFSFLYWITFASFLILMLVFVSPTFDKSFTWLALILLYSPHLLHRRIIVLHYSLLSQVQGLDITWSYGGPPASAGLTTRFKNLRCLQCLRMGWRRSLFGGRD